RVCRELMLHRGDVRRRGGSSAPRNLSVVDWAESLPREGFVLDLGCGVGRHMVHLGERGFRMAGIDISPTGVRLTHQACAARHIRFEAHISDMSGLPWTSETFDAALSISTIHHHLRQATG